MGEVYVNKVINDSESGAQYLVLWIAPENDYGYWHALNNSSRVPTRFVMEDVVKSLSDYRFVADDFADPVMARLDETLTNKEIEHRERIWRIMKPVVESEPDIYEASSRAKILRDTAAESGVDRAYLYKLLDRYWRTGKTKNAYIPAYSNSGGKGKQRDTYKRREAGLSAGSHIGKTLTDSDRKNFKLAVKHYYLTRTKLSFKAVYEKLLQDYYTVRSADDTGKLKLLAPSELPSFRQFQYWYSKNRDIIKETKKREGESKFELNNRGILGKADYGLMGPGAQYQIDATVGDVYLVSQFDRTNLIGRPVIYFVIDAFSRMVTGMGVALEGPSWASGMMAIANMAADKVAYCRKYGIEITESEWPCHHVPAAMIGDRGEMESKNADNLVNMLGIRIVNAPPYRADLKGIIEQHFRTINTNSVALLPGSVKPDMSERGGRDYRLDAALDIRQFTQIIIKCVLYYNNHHYMDYFEKSEAMMKANVDAIPCRIWDWGIHHCSGILRSFPEEMVRMAVLPTDNATVTERGIKFKGTFYSSEKAIREAWFEKARSKKSWRVTVSYDPHDMANMYIWDQDDKKYDKCYLLEWNQKYAGKYLDEIIYQQRKETAAQKQLKLSETEAKVNLNAEIDAIVSEAKGMSAGLPAKSKRERVSQINENRRYERDSMRQDADMASVAVEDAVNEAGITRSNPPNEDLDPILQMIKGKVEERLKND